MGGTVPFLSAHTRGRHSKPGVEGLRDWVVDSLVGWLLGSVAFGLAFRAIGAFVGGQAVLTNFGVVAGTIVGIAWMRQARRRRRRSG